MASIYFGCPPTPPQDISNRNRPHRSVISPVPSDRAHHELVSFTAAKHRPSRGDTYPLPASPVVEVRFDMLVLVLLQSTIVWPALATKWYMNTT